SQARDGAMPLGWQLLGAMAEWLCSGLQIRDRRFDSGLRLQDPVSGRLNSRKKFLERSAPKIGPDRLIVLDNGQPRPSSSCLKPNRNLYQSTCFERMSGSPSSTES